MQAIWAKHRRRRCHSRPGFTLIEAALATVIIGLGVVSMMELFGACTTENSTANGQTTAMLLASNIREAMAGLPLYDPILGNSAFGPQIGQTVGQFTNVTAFDGSQFSPPIDAARSTIPQLTQYTQVISVMPVDPTQLSVNTNEASPTIAKATYTGAVRVRVHIYYQRTPTMKASEVFTSDWIVMDR